MIYSSHKGISTSCVRRYIPKVMKIIPMNYVCRYNLEATGIVPLLSSTVHGVHNTMVYQRAVFVDIF